VVVSKDQVVNRNLKGSIANLSKNYDSTPVIAYSVKAEKINNKVVISQKISEKNDMYLAVVRGTVNPYFTTPGYSP
jgi:hypothetical protein